MTNASKLAITVFLIGISLVGVCHSFIRFQDSLPWILLVDVVASSVNAYIIGKVWS